MKIFVKKCGDHLRMIPKKLAPASIGVGSAFRKKIMLHQKLEPDDYSKKVIPP